METKQFNIGFTRALVVVLWMGGCGARVAGPRDPGLARALEGGGEKGSAPPFAANSPFNLRIPENAIVDSQSDAMVAYLARKKKANAALYEFAIPIWSADASTPRFSVRCSMSPAWGRCPFAASFVPIP